MCVRGLGAMSKDKSQNNLDLKRFVGKSVIVKFTGGREVTGVLKGYDPLANLVLDDCVETLRSADDPYKLTDETRRLGLVVARGPSVMLIMPTDGRSAIDNPWTAAEPEVI